MPKPAKKKGKVENRASVAVAMIAKNAEKTIGACLDSIVPYVQEVVVCVDRNTTDKTAAVAQKHGAKVFTGLVVSEMHECPDHGRVEAQHFAKARAMSFSKLRKDVDWQMWLDSDDVVINAKLLPEYLSKIPPQVGVVWMPYDYAQAVKDGPSSTMFDRERLIRTNIPWQWLYRVHEILAPVDRPMEHVNAARTSDIYIKHQGEGHDTAGSARRNILLLEIDLEENPEDMRAWFYLGNQYFALGEWDMAKEAYLRATGSDNPYQLWQTWIYVSMCAEKLQDMELFRHAVSEAEFINPLHAETEVRKAVYQMMMGKVEYVRHHTANADKAQPTPGFVFSNPLDVPYNARLTLAQAEQMAGFPERAAAQLRMAAAVIPTEQVLQGIAESDKLIGEADLAEAYRKMIEDLKVRNRMHCSGNFGGLSTREMRALVPDAVWKFGRVRDLVVPDMEKDRQMTHGKKRIIFWCGKSLEPWAPPSMNKTGIGGSETAVIEIAKRFAADGWRVDVYNDCDHMEGVYEGVGYWDCKRLQAGESCEVFVSWRNPTIFDLPIQRSVSLLWCHDLNKGPLDSVHWQRWDSVMGVSQWHADYLSSVYGIDNTSFVPNGIDLGRFTNEVAKVPFRCVYGSSPDRGLVNLLRMWPDIAKVDPAAELHVAYGWQNIDRSIQLGWDRDGSLRRLKAECEQLIAAEPSVKWRGRLGQDELAKLYQESYAWLYPTPFLEVSCITAMEAMAGGAVPITSAAGALPETIGEGGAIIKGNTYTQAWKEYYVACARGVLMNRSSRFDYMNKGNEQVKGKTWDAAYQKWQEIVTPLLEGEKEKVTVG